MRSSKRQGTGHMNGDEEVERIARGHGSSAEREAGLALTTGVGGRDPEMIQHRRAVLEALGRKGK